MDNPIPILIEMQGVDTAIKVIAAKKNEIPHKLSVLENERGRAESLLEEAKALVADLAKKHKEKENVLVRAGDDLRKTKSKQFDVKTNKEFEAVLKEMETIELKIGHIEEEILVTLDEIEQAKVALTAGDAKFKDYLRECEARKGELNVANRTYDDELAELTAIQQTLKSTLPADVAKKYEAIKALHSGFAVVSVVKGVCQGCFVNIPPQMNNELMTSKTPTLCPRCNRIIFYQVATTTTATVATGD